LHNRAVKKAVKTQLKKFATAASGPIDQLHKEYDIAAKKLDKAAAKRIIHPNLAARKKSQMARLVHQKETTGKAAPK
jgi:small subunit ribosomal protein S20